MKILFRVIEHATWLFCVLIGAGVPLISLPIAVLGASVPQGEPFIPAWQIIGSVVGAALVFGSGFLMFANGWPARMANLGYRCATTLLLLLPIAAGVGLMLAARGSSLFTGLASMLVAFAGWVLLLCWKPGLLRPRPAK